MKVKQVYIMSSVYNCMDRGAQGRERVNYLINVSPKWMSLVAGCHFIQSLSSALHILNM